MRLMEELVRQCRKPEGWFGTFVGRGMNIGHASVRKWGLTHVTVEPDACVLDVGCGGGKAVKDMAHMAPAGKVYGLDYSEEMVRLATRVNRRLIEEGRVEIRHGTVSSLPFPDGMFDLATASEACYFWPNFVDDLVEVRRVLKAGGTLLIANEAYIDARFEERNAYWASMAEMELHTPEEYDKLLSQAGYVSIEIDVVPEKNWISILAKTGEHPWS